MRIALVGGSNGLVSEGLGEGLSERLGEDFTNFSLGDSSSLRGVDFLLSSSHKIDADKILFEYTLNDLIFESANTIDPIAHLRWLEILADKPEICKKLIFVNLCGANALPRAEHKRSIIIQNYDTIARRYNIQTIDCIPDISDLVRSAGKDAVFIQYNHFTAHAVGMLCDKIISQTKEGNLANDHAVSSHIDASIESIDLSKTFSGDSAIEHFKTSVFEGSFLHLSSEKTVQVDATGDYLIGFYALLFPNSGFLKIEADNLRLIKPCGHHFELTKPFVALRHLSSPIPIGRSKKILLSVHSSPFQKTSGFDHTHGAALTSQNQGAAKLALGRLLFLKAAA